MIKKIINTHRGLTNRFGFALQLGLIRQKGRAFISHDFIQKKVLTFIEEQLKISKEKFFNYTKETTIFNYYKEIREIYDFKIYSGKLEKNIKKDLENEVFRTNDSFFLISNLINKFKLNRIIIPGITIIEELISKMLLESEEKAIIELNKYITQRTKRKNRRIIKF